MGFYQEGYDTGYDDGIEGNNSKVSDGLIWTILSAFDDESQTEWENGYTDGYENGKREREENENKDSWW